MVANELLTLQAFVVRACHGLRHRPMHARHGATQPAAKTFVFCSLFLLHALVIVATWRFSGAIEARKS